VLSISEFDACKTISIISFQQDTTQTIKTLISVL